MYVRKPTLELIAFIREQVSVAYCAVINLHKNNQVVKKSAAHAKRQHEKSCEIQGGVPDLAVMAKF